MAAGEVGIETKVTAKCVWRCVWKTGLLDAAKWSCYWRSVDETMKSHSKGKKKKPQHESTHTGSTVAVGREGLCPCFIFA